MTQATGPHTLVNPHPPGIERLRTLYSIIPGVPNKKVCMLNWRSAPRLPNDWHTRLKRCSLRKDEHVLDPECGTTACAIGLACAYPEFKAQGFSWDEHHLYPVFKTFTSWDAVCAFFEIEMCDAEHIFSGIEYGSKAKRLVMSRIRGYLLTHGVITQQRSNELALEENQV